MPHLKQLADDHAEDGLVILGVHSAKGGEKMAAFVEQQDIGYVTAWDLEGKTQRAFHADSFPDYYLVDRAGVLRFADLANNELDRAIAKLLAEPAPPAEDGEGDTDATHGEQDEGDG